jgi:uncharacterized protein
MAAEISHQVLKADQTLVAIVQRLAEAYEPERIYLFGSRARGDFRPESDYDLLVILPDDAPLERQKDTLGSESLRYLKAAVSVVVHGSSYFEARRCLKASLPGIVTREGKLLYGREGLSATEDGGVAKSDDTREWLRKAEEDLKSADLLFGASPPLSGAVLFHCQQATEKALKALLAWYDVPFGKSHNIEDLGKACLALDTSLSDSVERACSFTDYAWKFRYSDGGSLPSLEITQEAVETARLLFQAVLGKLAPECKP